MYLTTVFLLFWFWMLEDMKLHEVSRALLLLTYFKLPVSPVTLRASDTSLSPVFEKRFSSSHTRWTNLSIRILSSALTCNYHYANKEFAEQEVQVVKSRITLTFIWCWGHHCRGKSSRRSPSLHLLTSYGATRLNKRCSFFPSTPVTKPRCLPGLNIKSQ